MDRCPVEVVMDILDLVSAPTLSLYAATSKFNSSVVRDNLRHRILDAVRPFFGDPGSFLDMLTLTRAIVSGSLALRVVAGRTDWAPRDMDIYVSARHRAAVYVFLCSRGWRCHGTVDSQGDADVEYRFTGVSKTIHFARGSQHIDVLVSRTRNPVQSIFHFHSTVVMNFFDAHVVFSAYPSLVDRRISMLNRVALVRDAYPHTRLVASLRKYRDRGYSLVAAPPADHVCGTTYTCLSRHRRLLDGGCLRVNLTAIPVLDLLQTVPLPSWILGGCQYQRDMQDFLDVSRILLCIELC